MSYHRDRSKAVIAEAIAEGERRGLSGAALAAHVSSRYPFALADQRAWPIWRTEFDRLLKPKKRAKDEGGDLFRGGV